MSTSPTPNVNSNRLRRYRKERNLRVRDIARLVGILNPGHVWQWESGRRTPSLRNAMKLAAAINCPLELLFREDFDAIRRDVAERRHKLQQKAQIHF